MPSWPASLGADPAGAAAAGARRVRNAAPLLELQQRASNVSLSTSLRRLQAQISRWLHGRLRRSYTPNSGSCLWERGGCVV